MTKRVCKVVSMMLILAIVIQLIPKRLFVQAETISLVPDTVSGTQDNTSTELGTQAEATPATIVGEMVDKRTENAKYFRLSDGSYSVAQYMYDVHYKTDEGYVPYDNTLLAVRSGEKTTYQPARSDLGISFAGNNIQEGIFQFGRNGYTVSVSLAESQLQTSAMNITANVEAQKAAPVYADSWEARMDMRDTVSSISYNNVLSDTSLSYTLLGSTIKESIILNKKPAKSSWKFKLTLNGLVAALQENGDVYLISRDTKTVQYTIPKGYMFDANNYVSEDVTYTLETCKDGVYLTVHADTEWLASSDRVYPITVDPTFWVGGNPSTTISDAHVLQGNPTLNTKWYNILMAGYSSGSTFLNMRTYLKLKTLPTLPDSAEITSAVLQIKQVPSGQWYSYNSTKNYVHIGAYEVLGAWDDGTITWNNQPAIETAPMDYIATTASTADKLFKLNITTAARGWYESSNSNYGVALHAEPETWNGQVSFVSGDDVNGGNPCLYITYRDMRGIEDVYSYDQENVGNAGTGFVNLYTGNLVFAQGGMTSAGNILPMQVGLVYNGYQKGLPFTKNAGNINAPLTGTFPIHTGYGWKLNILETIQTKTFNAGTAEEETFLVYTDGDGTEIYFREFSSWDKANQYYSEAGHPVTITVLDDGQYVMEDDDHNKKWFDTSGRFVAIEDTQGNEKEIIYSSGFPVEIRYNHGGTLEEYEEFFLEYNSAGALIKVINGRDTTRYVEYLYADTYNGTPNLTGYKYLRGVRYSTGEEVTYTYLSNSALYSAKDEQNKIEVRYSYNGAKVSQIDVLLGNGALADTRTFSYADKRTTVRTKGADDVPNTADDYLNAYTFDTYGRTVSRYVTDLNQSKLYGVGHTTYNNATNESDVRKQNTIADQSSVGNLAQNLIREGNCESLWVWNYVDPVDGYISCTSNQKYYGDYSLAISLSTPGTGSITQQYQAPTTGTYTLSAYVRASGVEPKMESNGAKILLNETSSFALVDTTGRFLEWERLIVSRHYNAGEMITVTLQLDDSSGLAYFDCVQLELGSSASAYNFIDDGDFDSGSTAWDVSGGNCSYLGNTGVNNSPCIEMAGGLLRTSTFPQTIPMNLNLEGKLITLFVSGWGKGKTSVYEGQSIYKDLNDTYASAERDFAIRVVLTYQGIAEKETHLIQFNPAIWDEWQFASGTIQLETTGKLVSVEVSPYLSRNAADVYFDNFSLIIGSTTQYTYDLDGYLTGVVSGSGNQQEIEYTNHQVTSVRTHTNDDAYMYEYYPEYSEYRNQLMRAWYPNGMEVYYGEYDNYGNVTSQVIYSAPLEDPENEENSNYLRNEQEYTYDYFGNFLASETNPHGTTTYDYNEATGVLNYVQNANNNRTSYIYDASGKLLQVFADSNKNGTKDGAEQGVQYVYDTQNRLTCIVTASTTYHFTYNDFGQTTAITVGGRTTPLARYTYNAYGGKLIRTDYADGTYIENTYDDHGRVHSVSYNGIIMYTVTYDGQGNVSSYIDTSTGYEYRYDYDEIDRIRQHWIISGNDVLLRISYTYQGDGRIEMISKSVDELVEYPYWQLYDTYGNISELRTYNATVYFSYDSMNRLTERRVHHAGDIITTKYTYYTSGEITTDRVSSMEITLADDTQQTIAYTYDALGNITGINDGTETRLYTYDALNQLTSEIIYTNSTKIGTKVTYSYDQAGNLVSKTKSVYNDGIVSNSTTDSYTYGDSDWGDLLTAYNGEGITYDANGNPLSYYNGKRYTFSWQYGRRLASLGVDGKTYTYTYNADGLRVTKTVDGVVHTYYYDGTELLMEKWGDCYLRFTYDEQGRPLSVFYFDGSTIHRYHYVLNLQGDVIAILDSGENIVCKYTYDAWGKILSMKDGTGNAITAAGHIGNLNPLRYRGYYYDSETGLYYLRSRYYDPVICRFVNADESSYLGANLDLLGYDLFTYCSNNPVMNTDPTGCFVFSFAAVLKVVLIVAAVVATANDVYQIASGNVTLNEESISSTDNGDDTDNVQIKDSYKILTPWVQFGYSFCLNYIHPDTKNVIDGSTIGTTFEWGLHNIAYVGCSIIGLEDQAQKAKSVDVGKTLFSDSHGDIIEHGMKISYMILNPLRATTIYDLIINGGY